jgi:hypothetical protein
MVHRPVKAVPACHYGFNTERCLEMHKSSPHPPILITEAVGVTLFKDAQKNCDIVLGCGKSMKEGCI